MGSTPTCRAMWKNQRVRMTIEQITSGETVMEGVTIDGPDTTTVVRVFTALYDLVGADEIGTPGLPEKVPSRSATVDSEDTMP